MLKMFAFIFLVFSQSVLAESDEIYHCGKNTYQSMPCAYTKNSPASQIPVDDNQPTAEKPLKDIQKHSKASKPKPLTVAPKAEPVTAPTKPAPPVVTKKQPIAAPPMPKPLPEPAVEKSVSKPAVALPEPAPVKAPEPVTEPIKENGNEPQSNPQDPQGVCASLKAGLDNIANQRKNGASSDADLNRQQKELENAMKSSGC
jgi:hypothetical protein